MKNTISTFCLLFACHCFGQDVSVEKSIFGIQTGPVGLWVNNEVRLSNKFTLRTEVGFEMGFVENYTTDETSISGIASVALEPKYYYNLAKRSTKGRRTKNNSGNAISLKLYYYPDLFLITNVNGKVYTANQLGILPSWSMRRVYGRHFTFETGLGIGPKLLFGKEAKYIQDESDVFVDLHLRIGYTF